MNRRSDDAAEPLTTPLHTDDGGTALEYPIGPDDIARVESLRRLDLLDTPGEERFDRITRLAARIAQTPIAMIAVIDAERQWNKSVQGPLPLEVPRAVAFCNHTILGDVPLVVEDATRDARFAENPSVTAPDGLRFYVGIPLRAPDGYNVATLCVLDVVARSIPSGTVEALDDLARVAEAEFAVERLLDEQTRLRAALTEAERRASLDGLTRTWNRVHVLTLLERCLETASPESPLSVAMIDIDHFKSVNDTYGHPAGDAVIASVAQHLRRSTRTCDVVGRYGGEEFLVVLPRCDGETARRVCERIRQSVATSTVSHAPHTLQCTVSVGYATLPPTGEVAASELLARADEALYAAKRGGRNRVVEAEIGG